MNEGVKFGRKDVVDDEKEYQIYQLRKKGKSIRRYQRGWNICRKDTQGVFINVHIKMEFSLLRTPFYVEQNLH